MDISSEEALQLLRSGGVVAIPTDTVYGLAADMTDPDAVEEIFRLKQRPANQPLIVLVDSAETVLDYLKEKPPSFDKLTTRFWPGPLTLVLPVKENMISDHVLRGHRSAGFRVPAHPLTRELIKRFGPIVATSANVSGKPPPTTNKAVKQYFGHKFPILNGGECQHGVPSTILHYQEEDWKILREGTINSSVLEGL